MSEYGLRAAKERLLLWLPSCGRGNLYDARLEGVPDPEVLTPIPAFDELFAHSHL